ncbi:MAG: amidohydrolase family protein [Pseudomonadota bacterium]
MTFIDAHHHLWAPQSPALDIGYVWLKDIGAPKPFGDPTPIQRDYLWPEFAGECSNGRPRACVHVQADPKLPDPVAETAFIQRISDETGVPIMIVGFADLTSENFAHTLERHMAHPNLRGIRQIISYLPDRPDLSFAPGNLLDVPLWQENFERLADHGMSFDLQLYPEQMLQAAALLARTPAVPVVIDHLGSPYDTAQTGLARWQEGMTALAALDHVRVKLSGYAMFFGADLGPEAQHVTAELLRLFGPERCMFGSNFPVDKLHLTYDQLVAFVSAQTDNPAAVFGETAAEFYRIPSV